MQEVHGTLPTGATIQGRYVVEAVLGKGKCGATYLVHDKRDSSHRFVLKEVIAQAKGRKRIPSQIAALKRLNHPALPRIHQVLYDDTHGHICVLMDYIEGSSLASLLAEQAEQRFPLLQVMPLIAPVMDAVMYLHNRQPSIVHQKINLSNMIVPKTGGGIVLVGLGFAQENETDATIVLPNATGYTAPELCSGNRSSSSQTDIYALGATLYTLLTGIVPTNALYRLRQLLEKDLDPLRPVNQIIPAIPPHIAQAIHRAMSVSSSERFSTVEQFWEALWQVVTFTSEVQQLPNSGIVPAGEEKREQDTYQVVQQPAEPEVEAPAEEMYRSHTALAEQQVPDPILAHITPPRPSPLSQKELETPNPVFLREQSRTHTPTKTRWLSLILIVLLATLSIIGIGASLWFYAAASHHSSSAPPAVSGQHQATPHVTSSPNSIGTATPTSVAGSYPRISKSYTGTIHDLSGNVATSMSLTNTQQQQQSMSGYFTGLGLNSPFKGTIDTTGHIQFIITGNTWQVPLSFDGMVRTDKNVVGTYCRGGQAGSCSAYGFWSVSPGAS